MGLLAGFALMLLVAGTYLLSRGLYVWDGGLFVLLGLSLLTSLILTRRDSTQRLVRVRQVGLGHLEGWVRVLAIAISLGVALTTRLRPSDAGFAWLFLAWLFALVAFAGSLVLTLVRSRTLVFPDLKRERWALVALLVAAGLVRCIALDRAPANLGGDEGTQLVAALKLTAPPMGNPFATGWYSVPTMSFLVYGLGMRVFGATVAGGRALSAIAGTATVLATYLLGRALDGRRTGWIAALIVAVSAYHIHYSRLASNQILDPLIGTLVIGLVWLALRLGSVERGRAAAMPLACAAAPSSATALPSSATALPSSATALPSSATALPSSATALPSSATAAWGLAGVVAGLGWYAYFGARWVVCLVALVVVWQALADRKFLERHWPGLLLFGLGWLVAVLPLLGWYARHPSAFTERYNAVSIFRSGWLEREIALTGRSAFRLLLQQFWRSVTAFHLTVDPTFWYGPDRPLIDFVSGGFMLIGMVDSVIRLRQPSRVLAHLWFWSTLVMAWVLTENPPSSQRGVLLIPVVALFISWGVDSLISLIASGNARLWVSGLLGVIAVLNLVFYFVVYVPLRVYGNPTAESATRLAQYVLDNPQPVCETASAESCPGRVYMLGPPWTYWDMGTLAFMLRHFPGESVPLGTIPDDVTGPARFIIVAERQAEMPMLYNRYPDGQETPLFAPDGRTSMIVYDWPGSHAVAP